MVRACGITERALETSCAVPSKAGRERAETLERARTHRREKRQAPTDPAARAARRRRRQRYVPLRKGTARGPDAKAYAPCARNADHCRTPRVLAGTRAAVTAYGAYAAPVRSREGAGGACGRGGPAKGLPGLRRLEAGDAQA
jgi:hypothetical protein